ncbi:hypothetical protein HYPSUDRAFT_37036 [Hypholoma sublateritium FD-334 SS-4]|uniref:Peptidase S26 domain-containing protein n=1 Tax=Hypholoma sublateritium (strain FD-334 SS-4) TaxID=945553 RepID=A0A0D2PC84_HYPSF|nr:hypothetical protein HYPSUDRAFT_37036 [Hypholoma sublateritium FD-334 SS-4]
MLPTFATSGELVLEDRLSLRHLRAPLVRGDLLVVESPLCRGQMVCKRLIGLPGDVVCVDPTGRLAPSAEHVTVPAGHVWIAGDNAAWSRDSREYGPVPMALVRGRIVARVCAAFTGSYSQQLTGQMQIWPPHKFTLYPSGSGVSFLT